MIWRPRSAQTLRTLCCGHLKHQKVLFGTNQPAIQPTSQPTRQPTNQPANQPTGQPASQPTSLLEKASKKLFYLASKSCSFGIKKSSGPRIQKSFVFEYFSHSWMDGLGSLRRALLVVWRHPDLTEAVICRPGGAQTLRTL